MRGYRPFIIVFASVFVLYIVAELNKPKKVNWTVTLSKNDKIPYGGFAVFSLLRDIFPGAAISSHRSPAYTQVNNYTDKNSAYIIITPEFNPSQTDKEELDNYVTKGNYLFVSANSFQKSFLDSLRCMTNTRFTMTSKDSTSLNFINPVLRARTNYTFLRSTIDQYFTKVDTAKAVILGVNNFKEPTFIKIPKGEGAYFINANPICFSNYFLISNNNASYTSKALSYIPAGITKLYWDEYYKGGRGGAKTPLRVFLSNEYLRWALRLALIGMLLYVLVQMKRKQRIIPVIEPLRNTTLDFARTVAGVYFNERNNNNIAQQKINYFLDFVRQRYNLATQTLDVSFKDQLARKSGVDEKAVEELVSLLQAVPEEERVSDRLLIVLNNKIDNFYNQV